MARTFPGDYADRAYERFCAKRDREAQKSKRGGHGNGHPLKSKTNVQDNQNSNDGSKNQRASLEFFRKHGDLIQLRRDGKTLQEIADKTGDSRLGVFRKFQKAPSAKLKIELGVPT